MCNLIKRLVVDHLHIVGDIFDRGPRADIIMDLLMEHHSVDIQWGNHDVLWMGAATGSRTCIATVLSNSITYNNLDVIETATASACARSRCLRTKPTATATCPASSPR